MTSISSLTTSGELTDPMIPVASSSHVLCKLEVLTCLMPANNIDIYLLQETCCWMTGFLILMVLQSFIMALASEHVCNHGCIQQHRHHAWAPCPMHLAKCQLLLVRLLTQTPDTWASIWSFTLKSTKQPSFLLPVYKHPTTVKWKPTTLASSPNSMKPSKTTSSNSHLIQLPLLVATSMPLSVPMIQTHLKMSLDHINSIICSNSAGEKLLDMAGNCSLQASATYFKHCSWDILWPPKQSCSLTTWPHLCPPAQCHGPHITNDGVYKPRFNVMSNHHATCLKLCLTWHLSKSKWTKVQNATDGEILTVDPINWHTLHQNALKHHDFADKVETIPFKIANCKSHKATPTHFLEAIMYAAESTITELKENAQPTS